MWINNATNKQGFIKNFFQYQITKNFQLNDQCYTTKMIADTDLLATIESHMCCVSLRTQRSSGQINH